MGNCWNSEAHIAPSVSNSTPPAAALKSPKIPTSSPQNGRGGGGGGTTRVTPPSVGKIIKPDLREYTYQEMRSATKNFNSDSVIGGGGFGRVYKGWINETTLAPSKAGVGLPVAVKKCHDDSTQGVKEWRAEIKFLGKFSHPNLVKLIGYCWEQKELLLVYEFMQKGSLEFHLFQNSREPLSWSTRIKIAKEAARGLDFLHTTENTVIYRDFKAGNILLDENYNAKLSDFGLARLGPPIDKSHVTTQAVGTYGYAAPEYVHSNHLYVRSDVYSFGVVLLEIITGLRAFDLNRPKGQTSLVDWYKPMLSDRPNLKKIVDPRMKDYPPQGLNDLTQLIVRCLENDPKNRPHMSEVVPILDRIGTIRMDPKCSKASSSDSYPNRPHSYHPSSSRHQRDGGVGDVSPRCQPYRHTRS
ncbi:hypothetical protein vseg_001603 [Gypsophila vaccaria]